MNRRTFLLASAAAQSRIRGANDRIRAGIIGAGGRGRYLTAQFKELGVDMGAVCDIYEPNLQAGLKEAATGAVPLHDYRKLLDDKSFDAVVVATPDHWHARMVIEPPRICKVIGMTRELCIEYFAMQLVGTL